MKKIIVLFSVFLCFFCSCTEKADIGIIGGSDGPTAIIVADIEDNKERIMYEMISAQVAKEIMDSGSDHIILDVREQEEYDAGHIPGAILLPYTEIEQKAQDVIFDKNTLVLVYCRSGRRSKIAAETLVELGYKNVKEFGGIIDWPYDIVK
ncbi:MAG: rhodanese-like domain-containing protein [Ruminococcaceae bacterium]|nr:rhodanese-like domain-containing protein [Oscillospiraceae bacterium]